MQYILWQILKDVQGIDTLTKVAIVIVVVTLVGWWKSTL
jgi:hypothetical protein